MKFLCGYSKAEQPRTNKWPPTTEIPVYLCSLLLYSKYTEIGNGLDDHYIVYLYNEISLNYLK